jgi:murein DD-endopeptidase MepM/ murein hydrolase activator NlpD
MKALYSSGKVRIIALLILLVAITGAFFISGKVNFGQTKHTDIAGTPEAQAQNQKEQPSESIAITDGDTFGTLMNDYGIDANDTQAILTASKDVYDLTTVRAGKKIDLYRDEAGTLNKIIYKINTEEYFQATKVDDQWKAEKIKIPYEVKIQTVKGTVNEILYTSALEQGIDELLVLDLAQTFQWTIDFALDIRNGDSYKVIYEARYLDGTYVMPGKILAAEFTNQGKPYYAYYYDAANDDEDGAYYDENGNSTQKMFLKAPVAFRYISSGFTTGKRYVSAFNVSTGHRAIDYAAAAGTPIQATADGTVTHASWSSAGYGNLVSIRHNATYSTNYAHQSKMIVKVGQKVRQGQTIGYVGSTGFSTGPHLHYELVKNGVKVNPQIEILPPGKPLSEENKEAFQKVVEQYKGQLEAVK